MKANENASVSNLTNWIEEIQIIWAWLKVKNETAAKGNVLKVKFPYHEQHTCDWGNIDEISEQEMESKFHFSKFKVKNFPPLILMHFFFHFRIRLKWNHTEVKERSLILGSWINISIIRFH